MLQALKSVQLVNRGLQQSRVARLQACSLRTLRQAPVVTILFAEPPGTKVPPPAALKKTPKIVGKLVFLSPLVLSPPRRSGTWSTLVTSFSYSPACISSATMHTPLERRLVTALVTAVTQWPDAGPSASLSDIAMSSRPLHLSG